MSYLDDLLGSSSPIAVKQAQPTAQISGVVQAQPNATIAQPGMVGPKVPIKNPGTTAMPAVPKVQADNMGLQRDDGISTDENLQPARAEKELSKPASQLDGLFNKKVTGVDGTTPGPDIYKNYDAMSPMEKAMYAQKYPTQYEDKGTGLHEIFNNWIDNHLKTVEGGSKTMAGIDKFFGSILATIATPVYDATQEQYSQGQLRTKDLGQQTSALSTTSSLEPDALRQERAAQPGGLPTYKDINGNDRTVLNDLPIVNKNPVQIWGDIAQSALSVYTPGLGASLLAESAGSQLVKQGIKELAIKGFSEGSVAGLQFGIAQAMSSGSHDPKEIAKIIAANTVIGGAGGIALSTAIPAMSKVIAGTKQIKTNFVDDLIKKGFSQQEAETFASQGGFLGKLNPKANELGQRLNELNKQWVENPTPANKKALDLVKKSYMDESQGGFVKNPFAKEETPAEPSRVKLELPKPKESDSFITSLRKTLDPINYTDDTTKMVYNNYTQAITTASERANQVAATFKDIPSQDGWHAVLDYEQGVPNQYSGRIQQTFDDLHKEALAKGLDVPYRENYVPQIYKNSPEEIKTAVANYLMDQGVPHETVQNYVNGIADLPAEQATRLKMTPNFAKARVLPNYQTAMHYGLEPKYTHPGQLAGAYAKELDRAVAGKTLVQDLIGTGKIHTAQNAPADAVAINLGFAGKGYYADPTLAKVLNAQFPNPEMSFGQKLAAGAAKVSRTMQEITLSGGVPNSDVNFFSIGQLIKNVTAGDLKAIPAFIRGNFDNASIKFFEQKAPVIKQMAQHGIDLSTRVGQMSQMYDNMVSSKSLGEALGEGWHRVFERKTFASFMPQLQINTFESALKAATKKGLSEMEAGQVAAETTKAFYGLLENTGRSKTAQDTLSSLFFAPKFREGVIRTLWNTGRSITTEATNPAFAMNRKLAAGMAISYGLFNIANKKLSGTYMWDNEPGHEFDLRIPLPNGKIAYVGFMPSFLSLPRAAASGAKAFVTGDFKTAQQKGASLLSQPLQLISQLASNKDYFGNPIYKENDSGADKAKEIAKFVGPAITHPYVKLAVDQLFPGDTKKPLMDSIMQASELPVKFSSETQLSKNAYYDAIDSKAKNNVAENKQMQPTYDKVQKLKAEGNDDEAQSIVDNLSDDDYAIYKRVKAADKNSATSKAESAMYKTYQQVQELKKQGQEDQAQSIVDDMSDEDYRIYTLVKNRFNWRSVRGAEKQ